MRGFLLLGSDTGPFLLWWLASVLFGIGFYPVGTVLFSRFDDKGWLFSKALGIGAGGYLVFVLCRFRLLSFTGVSCVVVTLLCFLICWLLSFRFAGQKLQKLPDLKVLLAGELVFLLVFFFWTWCSGFRPEALGTEKPMDYGFMAAMMRSEELPARDIWYSQGVLNYYYGGQYYAVYLTKLTCTRVNETYHLMRALVAAFCFSLSWSIVRQALKDRGLSGYVSSVGGLFAGGAVSLAGNVHYLLYGLFGSLFQLSGWQEYWFPSSTRYIGHNPLTEDQCIHEFPSYSFVLGDLHAHVVNLFLVLLCIGLMYAWFQFFLEEGREQKISFMDSVPYVCTAGILIGIFKWTNYWDFIIYFTVFLFTAMCIAFWKREKGKNNWIRQVLWQVLAVAVLQFVVAYPFASLFDSMFKGVGICRYHTASYQLLILWGVPLVTAILLAVTVFTGRKRSGHRDTAEVNQQPEHRNDFGGKMLPEHKGASTGKTQLHFTDVFFVMLSICGLGLVLIPELVYVRDIYEGGFARSNTMFKLTYQAFVMLGLMMSYSFFRILALKERKCLQAVTALCSVIIFLTMGYCGYAVTSWFGNVLDRSGYQGLDAAAFLEEEYPEDAAAIRYLENTVQGQPVVLEAPGDSYSRYCRVSSVTGLPTVEGWYVHEWLWRDDPEDLNEKREDIRQIYTGVNPSAVQQLLEQYDVSYVFIGSCEREEYGEALNEEMLCSLGRVCFADEGAMVIEISRQK
ncbi:MAG: DUF2298 domain-containing protein [Lachnospiraceae bacterium]|nr:DUF2298 domain-containing protein [Lachnospiraceae bacterium]